MLSVLRLHSSFSVLTQHLFGNPKQAGFEIMPATMSSGTQHIFKTKFASSCWCRALCDVKHWRRTGIWWSFILCSQG